MAKTKATIVAHMATAVRFLAKPSPFFWSPLQHAKVPESPNRAVFVPTTTDGQTNYFNLSLAHAYRVITTTQRMILLLKLLCHRSPSGILSSTWLDHIQY